MMGDWLLKGKLPLVGGHEGAGVVVAKGDAGINWLNGSCLNCTYCLQGDEHDVPVVIKDEDLTY